MNISPLLSDYGSLVKDLPHKASYYELQGWKNIARNIQVEAFFVIPVRKDLPHPVVLTKSFVVIVNQQPLIDTKCYQVYKGTFLEKKEHPIFFKIGKRDYPNAIQQELKLVSILPEGVKGLPDGYLGTLYKNENPIGYATSGQQGPDFASYRLPPEYSIFHLLKNLYEVAYGLYFLHHNKIILGEIRASLLSIINSLRISSFESMKLPNEPFNPSSYPEDITPAQLLEDLLKWDPNKNEEWKKAFEIASQIDIYQLSLVFQFAHDKLKEKEGRECEALTQLTLEMQSIPTSLSMEEILKRIDRIRFPGLEENPYHTYKKLCARNNLKPIPESAFFQLSDLGKYIYKTGSFFKVFYNNQNFLIGKTDSGEDFIAMRSVDSIGKGSYGKVHTATVLSKKTNTPLQTFALKTALDQEAEQELEREIAILQRLHRDQKEIEGIQGAPISRSTKALLDPSYCQRLERSYLVDLAESNYEAYMIRLKAKHPNFTVFVSENPNFLSQLSKHPYQVAQGVKYIHDKGIIHSDIKLLNILIRGETVYLADFGSARDTTLGEDPDPELCPYIISPLEDLEKIKELIPTNRDEAIETAKRVDRFQLGSACYTWAYWISSGFKEYRKYPYAFKIVEVKTKDRFTDTETTQSREYPNLTKGVLTMPYPFDTKYPINPNQQKFINSLIHSIELERPSLEEIISGLAAFSETDDLQYSATPSDINSLEPLEMDKL